jgi:hypothetical protein
VSAKQNVATATGQPTAALAALLTDLKTADLAGSARSDRVAAGSATLVLRRDRSQHHHLAVRLDDPCKAEADE